MDVKDVRDAVKDVSADTNKPSQFLKRAAEALKSSRVEVTDTAVRMQASPPKRDGAGSSEARSRANAAISVINLAEEATSEIEKLVSSISGIVEQADSPKISEQRRGVLEQEANQLVGEIRRRAQSADADGKKPLAGDKVSVEFEKSFAKTLEIVLPDSAKEAFGIGEIRFSRKDAIVQTRNVIAQARERLEQLKDAVKESKESVRSSVGEIEVAIANTEASGASIRDVDAALQLAANTRIGIGRDPQGALSSVGNLQKTALELLK
ncbi:MAG: hypothetical protein K1X79_09150 [Oligoflexia bacterium]|nr:hypothetical protein [Oligoflexia bacterium]